MDEDSGVKAPVTRLRRRLSVEQTEEKALTPNTPTKKRATRRAKPELDLIDENVVPETITPKRTTRKGVKDVVEPVEEKTVTPARRSTRIKSNTSIVSETAAVGVDSPRAKRAARRNSHLGSDSEAPSTPTRQTRRTRKDSASSIDKVDAVTKPATQITETIAEEPETITRKSINNDSPNNSSQNSLRKSPRLNKSQEPNNDTPKLDENNATPISNNKSDVDKHPSQDKTSPDSCSVSSTTNYDKPESDNINDSKTLDSTMNLINNADKKSSQSKNVHNKSTSALENNNFKSKKKRTKSWSTVCSPNAKESVFYSDNESKKNKITVLQSPLAHINNKGASGDSKVDLNVSEGKNTSVSKNNSTILNKSEIDTSIKVQNVSKEKQVSSEEFFNRQPSGDMKTEIIIEDSDSNSEKGPDRNHDNGDQCVPVVSVPINLNKSEQHDESHNKSNKINTSKASLKDSSKIHNDSVEPMDIDETIPENIILPVSEEPEVSDKNESIKQDSLIKSKRKSSMSYSPNNTENKSTLIISEIKDNSTNEINKLEKSQISSNDKSLSKSAIDLNKTQNNDKDRKNVSLNCLTSTPLQQKNFQKLIAPINTSIIKSNQDNVQSPIVQNTSQKSKSSKNESNIESSDEDDESDKESSKEKNEFLNSEASDAGDDYQSGDSQDEEERQFAEENEIVDKGVTLTSDEELSNDSDYEKDSFVVSSDEEDNELLEGTDDDLSMSDNELKMTAKSKKKYDERMTKQQKKASREMFEARHKLDSSKSKKKIIEGDDDSDSSEEEAPAKQKKKNRMRLDSSHEISGLSVENTSKVSKKSKRLSESVCNESVLNEKEITMHNESLQDIDPLATQIKQEQKTPKKDPNSTVDFVDANVANDTNVNKSIVNENLTDPLHAMDDEMSSSDSDTNNIIDNYDSVLNELNKGKKTKTCDTSLNIENKSKEKKKKLPLIDELNLTQVKTVLKNLKPEKSIKKSKNEKSKQELSKEAEDSSDSSSDSIDLNLLFSEESNAESIDNKAHDDKDAIPLKPSEAKTDIRVNDGADEADGGIKFFIDTKGEHSNEESSQNLVVEQNVSIDKDQSLKSSAKKKKNKSLSESIIIEAKDLPAEEITMEQNESLAKTPKSDKKKKKRQSESQVESGTGFPAEEITIEHNQSHVKTPKSEKKKRQSLSQSENIQDINETILQEQESTVASIKTPKSEKKKKRISESFSNNLSETVSEEVISTVAGDTSTLKTPKSDKKKKNRISESRIDTATVPTEEIDDQNIGDNSMLRPNSEKKKKKRLSESQVDITIEPPTEESFKMDGNVSLSKTPKSEKKKKRLSESQVEITLEPPTEESCKMDGNVSLSKTPKSEKKKKQRLSESQTIETTGLLTEDVAVNKDGDISVSKTPKSEKKKKRLSESQTDIIAAGTPAKEITNLNVSVVKTPKSDKKTKSHMAEPQPTNTEENSDSDCPQEVAIEMNQPNNENYDEETKKSSAKKKNKKKSKNKSQGEQDSGEVIDTSNNTSTNKRKRPQLSIEEISEDVETSQSKKKRKILNSEEESLTVEDGKKIKNKKRKQMEDDETGVTKVRKTNTLDKIPVPRLPASILNQLDDKPKIQNKKKPKLISTSEFIIEEVRRSKPSNYLEESIYLHEDSPKKKKPKTNIPKPKVLPTMPTASTSNTGYTTNFKVNVLPRETQFVAQKSNNVANFKEERMYNKNIKRLGTYEMYKRQRNIKLSKF